jgi:hypothetical protein
MELIKIPTWVVIASMVVLPIPVHARTIQKIVIESLGQSDIAEDPPSGGCRSFRPTPKQVREYFNKAYPMPAHFGAHERYSPCYASGTIEFDDKTSGRWKLTSGGTSTLRWDSGDAVTLFYRGYKWNDPFACMYGLSDEGEC